MKAFALVSGLVAAMIAPVAAQEIDVTEAAASAKAALSATFDATSNEVVAELTALDASAEGAEGFGHALLMNRHLAESTYMFAESVERDPSRAAAVTNLGVTAYELAAIGSPIDALDAAAIVALQREALSLASDEPMIRHNLAVALLATGDDDDLAEALAILEELNAADPGNRLHAVHLAEALERVGRDDYAARVLAEAFAQNPTSPAIFMANQNLFGGAPMSPGNACSVDFRCAEICPGGIIGQVNRVTCEIENSNAQGSCQAGEPFAQSYDCDAEFPRFGILIPGLDPGFSILTPWGSVDVLFQGDGSVEFRAKFITPPVGGVQAFVDSTGSYQPSTGQLEWDVGGGLQYGLFNQNPVIEAANTYDVGPSGVVRIGEQGKVETRLEAGRGVIISN